MERREDAAVGEVDADAAVDVGEDRDVVGRDVGLVVGLLAAPVVRKPAVEDRQDVGSRGEDRVVRRGSARELALATLLGLVDPQQREEVGGVVVHRELGRRLRAPSGLHAAGHHLLLHPHHPVPERVVRHQPPEVREPAPEQALVLLDRVVGDGEAAHDAEAPAGDQLVVDLAGRTVDVGMADVLAAISSCRQVACPHEELLERRDRRGCEPVDEVLVAGEVGADPGHRVVHLLGVDLSAHAPASTGMARSRVGARPPPRTGTRRRFPR